MKDDVFSSMVTWGGKKSLEMWRVGGVIQKNVPNARCETWQVMCDGWWWVWIFLFFIFFWNVNESHHRYCIVNKVGLRIKSPCLCVVPAGWQRGLAHSMPNFPLSLCKYHKMSTGFSLCLCASMCVCMRVSNWASPCLSVHASALSLIFYYLPLVFLSCLSLGCLSSAPGFPNVKWQQRGSQRARCTFLMERFYILTSLPSLRLHLARWGRKRKRQTEGRYINKLHINLIGCWFSSDSQADTPTYLDVSLADRLTSTCSSNMGVPAKCFFIIVKSIVFTDFFVRLVLVYSSVCQSCIQGRSDTCHLRVYSCDRVF